MLKAGRYIFTEPQPIKLGRWEILVGKAHEQLRKVQDESIDLILTSPPYFRLIDYGIEGQAGQEDSIREYLEYQQAVCSELLRIAKPTANLIWVIRDSWNKSGGIGGDFKTDKGYRLSTGKKCDIEGIPRKTRLCIPERSCLTIAGTGWLPTLPIVWEKNDVRRGAEDRPSYSYEHVYLFVKSPDHFWNRESVLKEFAESSKAQTKKPYRGQCNYDWISDKKENPSDVKRRIIDGMKKRNGALLTTMLKIHPGQQPQVTLDSGHIERGKASFPVLLAEILVNLASPYQGRVLDPYCGMGTTGLAAIKWERDFIGIELNPLTAKASRKRLENYHAIRTNQCSLSELWQEKLDQKAETGNEDTMPNMQIPVPRRTDDNIPDQSL
jgi:DNA modification methylase